MTEASLRDIGGSRQSLRQAIGRLDGVEPTAPARLSGPQPAPAASRFGGRWLLVAIAVGACAAVGAASLLLT